MTFRTRLLLIVLASVVAPVLVLAYVVRQEMTAQLRAQYAAQGARLAARLEADLARREAAVGQALARLRTALPADNRFRRAAVDRAPAERRYLLDYAGTAMPLAGLDVLQVHDASGRILSSGHFRNEYDRLDPFLPAHLSEAGAALVRVRAPDGPFLALARADTLRLGGRRFTLVGGVRLAPAFLDALIPDAEMAVTLTYPGGPLPADTAAGRLVRTLRRPFLDALGGAAGEAVFRITHHDTALTALRRRLDRWFLGVGLLTAALALAVMGLLAARLGRPLAALAEQTARLDLDRLDVDFGTDRRDEIGALARTLGAMTRRLREGAARLREAERRATTGELARQVNHDVKNGLVPLRNVIRHLTRLADEDPAALPAVFRERAPTLEAGIAYLETLAAHYARLSPRLDRQPCDVHALLREVARDRPLRTDLRARARVLADPVALRRILENLLDNAFDSLDRPGAGVTVRTEDDGPRVRLTVADEGTGLTDDEAARIFDDFYTTKPDGTGLGLSIVRRLVMDLDGTLRVESEKGIGSRFILDLPASGAPEARPQP